MCSVQYNVWAYCLSIRVSLFSMYIHHLFIITYNFHKWGVTPKSPMYGLYRWMFMSFQKDQASSCWGYWVSPSLQTLRNHLWNHLWISGWWFQPLWKILVNWNDHSQYLLKLKKFQSPPTRYSSGSSKINIPKIPPLERDLVVIQWYHGGIEATATDQQGVLIHLAIRGRWSPFFFVWKAQTIGKPWENHRKTIGKWWFNCIEWCLTLWLCQNNYGTWPLIVNFSIEHGDLP